MKPTPEEQDQAISESAERDWKKLREAGVLEPLSPEALARIARAVRTVPES